MPRMIRTFIAVQINDAVRGRAVDLIARLSGSAARVKWVAAENLHLTMKFLGEVELNDIHSITQALVERVSQLSPFVTEVFGAGAFPTAARPRTIWLGVRDGEPEMIVLHSAIDKALRPLGFRREGRRFQPHMTIGRVRGGGPGIAELGQLVQQNEQFEAGKMTTAEVVLFSSRLDPAGPIYEAVSRIKLRGS